MDTAKKILIVDDEKPLAHALELKLTHEGFDVVTVSNGEDALLVLDTTPMALIVCDLVMPKMDGFAVLEELKKRENKTPVIILSNLSQPDDKERSLELGARYFFVKSDVSIVEIVETIKSIF